MKNIDLFFEKAVLSSDALYQDMQILLGTNVPVISYQLLEIMEMQGKAAAKLEQLRLACSQQMELDAKERQ